MDAKQIFVYSKEQKIRRYASVKTTLEAVEKAARNLSRKHEKLPPHRVWRYGRSESEPPPTAPELVGISVLSGAMLRFINSTPPLPHPVQ